MEPTAWHSIQSTLKFGNEQSVLWQKLWSDNVRARHKDTRQGCMELRGIFETAAVPKEEILW